MPPRVRLARAEDLDVILEHRRELLAALGAGDALFDEQADSAYRGWLEARIATDEAAAFVCEDDGAFVASAVVWLQEVEPQPASLDTVRAYVPHVFTKPEARGMGHARRVLEAAMRWSEEKGQGRLALHASEGSRGFYERLGFLASPEMSIDLDP